MLWRGLPMSGDRLTYWFPPYIRGTVCLLKFGTYLGAWIEIDVEYRGRFI